MSNQIVTVFLVVVGIINFIPVIGIFSNKLVSETYSLDSINSDAAMLLRQLALLFGILCGFILYAASKPQYYNLRLIDYSLCSQLFTP
jgi:hypothetical protein